MSAYLAGMSFLFRRNAQPNDDALEGVDVWRDGQWAIRSPEPQFEIVDLPDWKEPNRTVAPRLEAKKRKAAK